MSRPLLRQLYDQASLLRDTLRAFAASTGKMDSADQETIKLIEEDLEIKSSAFEETRGGEAPKPALGVRVVVQTLKQDGSPIKNLRICYIAAALFGKEPGIFGKVSSPADELIPVGNYRVWAGTGCDAPPSSKPPTFKIRSESDKGDAQVTLVIP